ncbi:hypothetical protein HBA54_11010 [Pelagibius litoralis]|uniref:Uncharacterized protein n=1 Tax=Pelagibius litoralis TaxID=374515 RepID=A0A967C976_9PROT|nr:hypothetical protein [Pelagibius litoralis]NIA69117.1 hypothetical protein [Pelagibius litoralis]
MTSISTGVPVADARQIDTSKLKSGGIRELTGEEYRKFIDDMEKRLSVSYQTQPDTANHPAYQPYATVEVNGKVVARIDNHGWTQMSNSLGAKLSGKLPGMVNGQVGPALAQKRAEIIAEALGGKVVMAPTALTQPTFNNLPEPDIAVDQMAMHKDPLYLRLQKTKQIESQFRAQHIAQELDADDAKAADAAAIADGEAEAVEDGKSDAVRAFLEYMAKTPEERYFEAFLNSKGMTQEEFEALPPEEKQALMREFEDYVKQQVDKASAEQMARSAASKLL